MNQAGVEFRSNSPPYTLFFKRRPSMNRQRIPTERHYEEAATIVIGDLESV
jgi:hypothetical protein